jgi:hypothetical protein
MKAQEKNQEAKTYSMEHLMIMNARQGEVFYSELDLNELSLIASLHGRWIVVKNKIICNVKSKIRTCSYINEVTLQVPIKNEKTAIRTPMGYLINYGKVGDYTYLDKQSKDITTSFCKASKKIKTEASLIIDKETLECKTIFKTIIISK